MQKPSLINRIANFFRWKFSFYQFKLKMISDNPKPEDVQKNKIYVVGGKDYTKWVYLKCPDNCGEIIMLNLSNNKNPSWSVFQDKKGRVSINPSIHKLDGCKSHFWIKKGNIIWVSNFD